MKPCVLIPTFDNPRTLEAVVRDARAHCPDVIVVDDGSKEAMQLALRQVEGAGVTVFRHERNRGKGAALKTGFREARRLGFTHAVTLDADGQHLPHEIPLFLEAAVRHPETLFLGSRDLEAAGAGPGSRFGRKVSNFWTFVETGLRLPDTQTGFRCYPLQAIGSLHLTTDGYDFEVEVLVKAAWAGIPIASMPIGVRYFQGDDRVSHLRPVADFLRIGWLNTHLVALRICLPAPYLELRCRREFHEMPWWRRWRGTFAELFLREPGSPERIALSVGLGLFLGIAPVWGFQIALTLLAAHALGLSKPISVAASNVSFPLMIPPILYASLLVGRFALGLAGETRSIATLRLAPSDVPAWVVGSFILAFLTAVTGAGLTYLLLAGRRRIQKRKASAG